MSWLSRSAPSHQVQLGVTAVVSGVIAAGAVLGYQKVRRKERIKKIKDSIPEVAQEHLATKVGCGPNKTLEHKINGSSEVDRVWCCVGCIRSQ